MFRESDVAKYIGRKITAAVLDKEDYDDNLILTFEDGTKIRVFDDGQNCCENRFMTCDDDVSELVGHTLKAIEAKEASVEDAGDNVEEAVFVEISTDVGAITLVNHNHHNGYYGGFNLVVKEVA